MNRIVLLATAISVCLSSMASASNKTSSFIGNRSEWNMAVIELSDIHPLQGGTKIKIEGGNKVTILIVEKGRTTQKERTLLPKDYDSLIERLITSDLLTIPVEERAGLPDEASPTIILTNSKGETFKLRKWAGDSNKRFDDIYRSILKLKE